MEFDSILFLFRFLPIFLILYFAAPGRMKNVVLLLGSLLFYAWGNSVCAAALLLSVAVNYGLGWGIAAKRGTRAAGRLLTFSVALNVGVLVFFTYVGDLFPLLDDMTSVSFPCATFTNLFGLSVYTLQILSYLTEVYRGEAKPQKNLLDFAVYATLFPVLPAGPIVCYHETEDSLHSRRADIFRINGGMRRFVVGLAKKVLLADQFELLWQEIRTMDYAGMSLMSAWLGIAAFAMQLYFALSGYADMAIGLGRIMGFSLPENFEHPYAACSVTDFWRRWFCSFGRWLRDTVYIPLGGSRRGVVRMMRNLLIAWAITAIWCGAGWQALPWALWFVAWLILEKLFLKELLGLFPGVIGWFYTMIAVMAGWALLGLDSAADAISYLRAMFDWTRLNVADTQGMFLLREYGVWLVAGLAAMLPAGSYLWKRLEKSETGWGIALYRFCNVVFPTALLLLCIAYIL